MWDATNLGGSWKRGIVNPDLEEERKKCTFDQVELAKFILGDRTYDFLHALEKVAKANPELLENELEKHDMTREERFMHSWKRIHRLMQVYPEVFTEHDH